MRHLTKYLKGNNLGIDKKKSYFIWCVGSQELRNNSFNKIWFSACCRTSNNIVRSKSIILFFYTFLIETHSNWSSVFQIESHRNSQSLWSWKISIFHRISHSGMQLHIKFNTIFIRFNFMFIDRESHIGLNFINFIYPNQHSQQSLWQRIRNFYSVNRSIFFILINYFITFINGIMMFCVFNIHVSKCEFNFLDNRKHFWVIK